MHSQKNKWMDVPTKIQNPVWCDGTVAEVALITGIGQSDRFMVIMNGHHLRDSDQVQIV